MSNERPWRGGMTRRRLLETVGMAGGAAAVYETMTALGLLRVPEAYAGPPQVVKDAGKGQHVVILGAGVSGLTAAYELNNTGYKVTVLEAQDRVGGRSFTVRPGDTLTEINERGEKTTQTCKFDKGLYLNAGPGRIPYHHTAVLDYCTKLGVKLEPYIMTTQANLYQTQQGFDGRPVYRRRIDYDTRGYISELLAKAVNKGALDTELSKQDKERLLDLLSEFGQLQNSYKYIGTSRDGYKKEPGVLPGLQVQPLPFQALLTSDFWNPEADADFYQPDDYEWQDTLFQPVGGMDMVWKGFLPTVGKFIKTSREVVSIENTTDKTGAKKVTVVVRNTKTGAAEPPITADWCISTIPLPLLSKIKNNFDQGYRDAIASVKFEATCKVGWQADRRFWEQDDEIFGGISFTTHPITQMWYPSYGFFEQKGVLTGVYNYAPISEKFGALSPPERLKLAMEGAKLLHPNITEKDIPIDKGISIAWQNISFQNGGWADWAQPLTPSFGRLLHNEGQFWIAGDQLSQLPGWQEGAIRSAQYVVGQIAKPAVVALGKKLEAEAQPEQPITAPDTRALTRGRRRK